MKRQRGFSLIELLIALNLFAILLGAIMAIQASVLRQQSKVMGQALVASAATSIAKAFHLLGSSASWISAPAPGTLGASATFWDNMEGATSAAIMTGTPVRFHHFCIQPTSGPNAGLLWLYEGPSPMPTFVCGDAVASTYTRTRIAGSSDLEVTATFNRPPNENNLIQLSYTVTMPGTGARETQTMSNSAQIQIRGSML